MLSARGGQGRAASGSGPTLDAGAVSTAVIVIRGVSKGVHRAWRHHPGAERHRPCDPDGEFVSIIGPSGTLMMLVAG